MFPYVKFSHVDNLSKDVFIDKYLTSETGSFWWYSLMDSPKI